MRERSGQFDLLPSFYFPLFFFQTRRKKIIFGDTLHRRWWANNRNRRFGEDSVEKMVDWTLEHVPASSDPRILEIGSGNGTLLFALREVGYAAPHLTGVDYSPDAVKLARMVARSRNSERVAFHVCDFLSDLPPPPSGRLDPLGGWDLLLDKGTYDAIALGEKDESGRSPVAAYPVQASRLLREDGIYLITCKSEHDLILHADPCP
jgi:SAM-dependent methyltransferase